jgi:hypothetical protein
MRFGCFTLGAKAPMSLGDPRNYPLPPGENPTAVNKILLLLLLLLL